MSDNEPSGCGNDFALDNITFRECVKQTTQLTAAPKITPTRRQSATAKEPQKKMITPQQKKVQAQVIKPEVDTTSETISVVKRNPKIVPLTPVVLKTRENALVRRIETDAGEIKIDVYDNGEIDGDQEPDAPVEHGQKSIRPVA